MNSIFEDATRKTENKPENISELSTNQSEKKKFNPLNIIKYLNKFVFIWKMAKNIFIIYLMYKHLF